MATTPATPSPETRSNWIKLRGANAYCRLLQGLKQSSHQPHQLVFFDITQDRQGPVISLNDTAEYGFVKFLSLGRERKVNCPAILFGWLGGDKSPIRKDFYGSTDLSVVEKTFRRQRA